MVISVKKENDKLLNLPTITREILAYCDTEEALENLKEEWSNFKNFRPAIKLIENYTIQSEADEDFDLTKEISATKVISNYFDKEKPMKWDDLSDDFKNDYNVILDNLQKHLNKLIFQFKGVSLSYDTHNKKFVFSRKRNESDDYRNFNCLLEGNNSKNFISTSLLVLVDLTRFSSISNSYKTKVEFIWFKYIFGMAELEEFLKELLVQAKRDSKAKLKSFVNNVEFDGDYPAKLFNKKFVEDYIYKSVVVAARSSKTVTVEHILNTNEDEYFNSILKECLDVSKLSDQAFYALVRNQSDSFIIGYSDLPEDLKVEFVRDVIKRWGHQISPLSNMLTKKDLNDYFSRKEIFDFFKETLKELLKSIHQSKEEKYNVYYIKVDEKEYIPVSGYKPDFKKYLTEDELSELKSELIPILEKIQDVILVNLEWYNNKYLLESVIDPSSTKKENFKSSLGSLSYGEFLMWIFDLLDWYPTRVLLTKKISHLELKIKNNPEIIKDQSLYNFREDVVSMLLFKDLLEYAGADYVGCCIVETFFVSTDDYTIDSDDKFRKVLEISLGKNIEFLEYAGKNLNKDIYQQSKKSNLIHISAPEFKI